MQQYRVNYPLLIGLLVGTFVSSGAVYALWKFQIERRSDTLITEAQKAYEEADYKTAVQYYSQYVKIKPEDSEQRVKFAEACADLAEQFDASMEDRSAAVRVMESTLRELPNEKGLRRRLAELYGKSNMLKDALAHLDFVLDDPEARVLRASYLVRSGLLDEATTYSYKLIGYDPESDTFDPTKPGTAPNDPATYLNLAIILRGKEDRQELAERVMEQAVLVNPKSAAAHLARGQYLYQTGEIERGLEDFEKAYQISPEDANVLAAVAGQALTDKEYDKALQYINKGKELHPKNGRFYLLGAAVAATQQDFKTALEEINAGLEKIPPPAGYDLLLGKADMQLNSEDYKGVRQTIDEMRGASIRPEFCDWYLAKVLTREGKWFQANELLTKLRPLLVNEPRIAPELNYLLGLSYAKLGQFELAIRAFDDVLLQQPQNEPARFGKQQAAAKIGRVEDMTSSDPVDRAFQEELKKPKAEQKWADIEAMLDRAAEERQWDETRRKTVWGGVLLARKEWAAARSLAVELLKAAPDNAEAQNLALNSVRFDPAEGQGPAKALQLMDQLKLKDLPSWRLYKADLLIAIDDERTKPQLASLLTNIDDWSTEQKVQFWSGMAERYLVLRMVDDARRYMSLVAESQPDDLQTRMKMFSLALDSNDDEGAKAAQDAILKVVGSTNDENWLFTEARRRLALIRRNRQGAEGLDEIRQLLARALEQRPEWHELHALNAEVELLANNFALALKHLDQAESLGRLSPPGVAKHIQLLSADGQLARAAAMVNTLPESVREPLLGDLYAELLFRTNKIDDAIKSAKAQAEANPENHQLQYRYGQLLARSSEQPQITPEQKKIILASAVNAVEQSVKLQPDFADGWYSLILLHAMSDNREKAQQSLREMQLSLSGDSLQFVLAKCYEALGRWFDAEPMYRAIYEADPENIERAQQLAAFYVGPGYRQRDTLEKVSPLINQILRAGAEKKIPPSDRNLLWARRTGAKLLAASGDYQQVLKAERMLASNSQDGSLSLEDRLEMAQILAQRPEPASRIMAVQLLEEIDQVQPLGEAASLTLANLHFTLGQWNDCQRIMLRAVGTFKKSIPIRVRFASMLLNRGNQNAFALAERYIEELKGLAPTSSETFRLVALLGIKTNRQQQVHNALIGRMPRNPDPKTITDEAAAMLDLYSSLFVELKDLDRAEQIQQLLAKRDPKRVFVLAEFLGTHREVAKCFDLLDSQLSAEQIPSMIRVGVNVIRKRRDEIGDTFDGRVEGWLDRALRSNIGSVPLLLAKAEFLEVQQKYPEAISIYQQLLANPDMAGFGRAIVLNNLSYLMALADAGAATGGVDPLQLVQEAVQILGPRDDILDSRAVVFIARKQYDEAIQDLELSVVVNPSASKYFHKAWAHLKSGQNKDAIDSWTKAEELGLTRDSLNQLEHKRFEEFKVQIEKLRAGGA